MIVVVPAASKIPAPMTTAVFICAQAISFNAPLMMVKVDPLAAAPFVIATAEIVLVSVTGAAWTELAETAPAIAAAVSATPRFAKNARSFSSARAIRFCAARSSKPKTLPTSVRLLFSK